MFVLNILVPWKSIASPFSMLESFFWLYLVTAIIVLLCWLFTPFPSRKSKLCFVDFFTGGIWLQQKSIVWQGFKEMICNTGKGALFGSSCNESTLKILNLFFVVVFSVVCLVTVHHLVCIAYFIWIFYVFFIGEIFVRVYT